MEQNHLNKKEQEMQDKVTRGLQGEKKVVKLTELNLEIWNIQFQIRKKL